MLSLGKYGRHLDSVRVFWRSKVHPTSCGCLRHVIRSRSIGPKAIASEEGVHSGLARRGEKGTERGSMVSVIAGSRGVG